MSEGDAGRALSTETRLGCEEHRRLLDDFAAAVHELVQLHEQQFKAMIDGDPESNRFDLLIHMANEKKQDAKYKYMHHVETHGCSNFNVLNELRTRSDYR